MPNKSRFVPKTIRGTYCTNTANGRTAKECIKGRRSIRKFTAQPIDHSLLAEIIETASYSPSWKNTQITRYIAVEGELKDKIADECTSAFPNNGAIIKGAPMLIVVTAIKNRCGYERDGS